MYRRTFLALATVTPLAGCGALFGGGVEETLGENEVVEFDVEEGATLSVTVVVREIAELGGNLDVEREGVGFRLDHVENGIIDTRTIEDEETFEVEVDDGGLHRAVVIGGVADVTIE